LLHAKSNFTGRTNRDYQSLLPGPINGVILGQQLSIRLPFQYTLRTGPQMNAQNSVQRFATLLVNQQLGVEGRAAEKVVKKELHLHVVPASAQLEARGEKRPP
jgi:hypothetical protein